MVYIDFQRSENVKKHLRRKKSPPVTVQPVCFHFKSSRSIWFSVFLPFLGLQRETDSATTAGLEDTVSERHIQPLLGYDWIAGKLFG